MKPEHNDRLCNDFPELYGDRFYFECGDGWFDLIYTLSTDLMKLAEKIPKKQRHLNMGQVKEKFGLLRIYMDSIGGDAYDRTAFYDRIKKAEADSAKICEECGKDGSTFVRGGWYRTRCVECRSVIEQNHSPY